MSTSRPLRRRGSAKSRNSHSRVARRRLQHEPLELRLALDATGLPGNPFSPDLDLTAVPAQSVRVGDELVVDLMAAGAVVTDLDANQNPSGDVIRFQLDPDDTPAGATITAAGVLHWTPTAGQTGTFELVVLAIDSGSPPLADAEVLIVEVAENLAPDLAAISDTTAAVNEMVEITVSASDGDGDNLTFALDRDDPGSTLPDDAELEQLSNNTAVIRWTPGATDAGGDFQFAVLVTDDGSPPRSDREEFTVIVMSVAAVDDQYEVEVDGVLTLDAASGVLDNDSDTDGDTLVATLISSPANGSVSLAADGSFTYTPDSAFQGSDTFTYQADDGNGDVSQATVTILVGSTPVAVDDSYSTDEDTTLTVDAAAGVLDNDSDPDSDPLTASLVDAPSNGTLTLNSDGSFTYVPDDEFSGTDTFTYQASDGSANSPPATATITVAAVNDAPDALADSYTTDEDSTLTVATADGVLDNDSDAEGDALTATLAQDASNGAVTLNSDGSFTYEPDGDFNGTDTFTYLASDGSDDSAETTVTITVSPTNDAPLSTADDYAVGEDSTLTVDAAAGVLANDTDPDGDGLTATVVDDVTNGTLTLNSDGSFTYMPDADFDGTDSFTYSASDGVESTAATLVTITVAEQNTFSVAENSAAGTAVGTLAPENDLGSPVVYSIDDPGLDPALELAADDHITGNPAGSVVLIEYVDFQCPICANYHPVVEQLEQDFADELMIVTRHLPLDSVHPNARAAAIAAEAAGRQGQFDAFGDLLFANQDDWADESDPTSFFETYATQLALDINQFRSDVADTDLADRVARDADAAAGLQAPGTPTFYLNGQQITNPSSLQDFQTLIQDEIDDVDDVFSLDRLTGEITVRDSAALDFETNPSFLLTINAVGLDTSETIAATINVIDVAEGEAEAEGEPPLSLLDDVWADEGDWLDPWA